MIDRELTEDETRILQEAQEASTAFSDAIERLQKAFTDVLTYNLRERSRLEAELADNDALLGVESE